MEIPGQIKVFFKSNEVDTGQKQDRSLTNVTGNYDLANCIVIW